MFLLYETPGGYALFKIRKKKALESVKTIEDYFSTPEKAQKLISLKSFKRFENQLEAMQAATATVEGKLSKSLKTFLQTSNKDKKKLAICDKVLGGVIKEKLGIPCIFDESVNELMRGIRQHLGTLIKEVSSEKDFNNMSLGLAHSLSRYKLKFSTEKVDTMIVQSVSLLDDLDKELNIYSMRVKEWYGWHFPELAKIVNDNLLYAKTVLKIKDRNKVKADDIDFSDVLEEEMANQVKEVMKISMGTEISDEDILHITLLCNEVVGITEYRAKLFDYLSNRMRAIAPNLTHLVGEIVGARLIAHSGSLLNLAKQPASTVQIFGAEKALFRAIKSKQKTPKYGLIYNASFIGNAPQQHKGKVARMLAAKCSLSARVDALGEKDETTIGIKSRELIEERIKKLDDVSSKFKGKSENNQYGGKTKFNGNKRKNYDGKNDMKFGDKKRKFDK